MKSTERVLGWDLLRGLCAFCVAGYHLLYWQEITAIHTFGSYGVYLFFVLSGASLSYTYADAIASRRFSFPRFLWARYLRLAPLYVGLMVLVFPWKLMQLGLSTELFISYLTNATFLFGFYNPANHALLVGGWSLGIEVIFYLLFPFLMMSFRHRATTVLLFGALLILQATWIGITVAQPDGYQKNHLIYYQAPAFVAYFMGGCLIGVIRHNIQFKNLIPENFGIGGIMCGFLLLWMLNPLKAGDELLGWRGLSSAILCFVMVFFASRVELNNNFVGLAHKVGDATYGLYLWHPVIFFGCTLAVFPRLGISEPTQWALCARIAFGGFVIALAFGLALASEKYFEKPLRLWAKPKIQG